MKNMKRFLPAVIGISTFLSMTAICVASDDEDDRTFEKEQRVQASPSSSYSYSAEPTISIEPTIPGTAQHQFYQRLFKQWSSHASAQMKIGLSKIVRAQGEGYQEYALQLFLLNSFEHDLRAKTTEQHLGLVAFEKILERKDTPTMHYAIAFAASLSVMGTTDYPGMLTLLQVASNVPATYGLRNPMPLRPIIMETVLCAVPGDDFFGNHQKQHAKRAKVIKKTVKEHTQRTTDTLLTLYANMDSKVFYERMMAREKEKERMSSPIISSSSYVREEKEPRSSPRAVPIHSSPVYSSSTIEEKEPTTRASSTQPLSITPTITVSEDLQQDTMPELVSVSDEKKPLDDANLTS